MKWKIRYRLAKLSRKKGDETFSRWWLTAYYDVFIPSDEILATLVKTL